MTVIAPVPVFFYRDGAPLTTQTVTFNYRTADPWAVTLRLPDGHALAACERSMLTAGRSEPVGTPGIFEVRPDRNPDWTQVLIGALRLKFHRQRVDVFLAATYGAVPAGMEREHVDLTDGAFAAFQAACTGR